MAIIQALQPLVTGFRTWINEHANDRFSILSNAEMLSMVRKASDEARSRGKREGYTEGYEHGIEEGKREWAKAYHDVIARIEQVSGQNITVLMPAHEKGYYTREYNRTHCGKLNCGKLPGDSGPLRHAVQVSRPLPRIERTTDPSPRVDFPSVEIDWKLPTTEDPIQLNDEQPNDDTIKTQAIKKGA